MFRAYPVHTERKNCLLYGNQGKPLVEVENRSAFMNISQTSTVTFLVICGESNFTISTVLFIEYKYI